MNLVEVEIVGAEAFQAGLAGRHDVAAGAADFVRPVAHRHAELARQHDLVAAIAERLTEHLLGLAAVAVDVGSIEQRNALVERAMDDGAGLFRVDAHAKVVAAETGQ